MFGEKRKSVGDARRKQVGDGAAVPLDGEDLGFEAATLANRAGHKNVGEKLHLHALVAQHLAVVETALAAVERKTRSAETSLFRRGSLGVKFSDEIPRLGVERGIRA